MAHEFDGRKYERASAHQKEWGTKLIAELGLRGSERVLDLGCGDGTLTAQIAALLPRGSALGIDASEGMIGVARQKRTENLDFLLMDINDLSFVEEFNVVYSNATLHWVKDHQLLLANVQRCLRPDGLLRFNFAGDGNCSHFFKVVREAISLDSFSLFFVDFQWPWYMPAVGDYETIAGQSDLRDVRVWGENADRLFPDAEALTNWIDQPSLVPFLPLIGEQERNSFRDYVVQRMIEETAQPDGRYFETFRRINVFARK